MFIIICSICCVRNSQHKGRGFIFTMNELLQFIGVQSMPATSAITVMSYNGQILKNKNIFVILLFYFFFTFFPPFTGKRLDALHLGPNSWPILELHLFQCSCWVFDFIPVEFAACSKPPSRIFIIKCLIQGAKTRQVSVVVEPRPHWSVVTGQMPIIMIAMAVKTACHWQPTWLRCKQDFEYFFFGLFIPMRLVCLIFICIALDFQKNLHLILL